MIRLSPSTLNLYRECPRCFWLHIKENIHRPQGPFPSLPGGMDLVIKDYFDTYRDGKNVPPEIVGKVRGVLFPNLPILNTWRNWRTGLRYEDKKLDAALSGALDDCLQDGNVFIPLDYKTRGSAPKEDGHIFYQGQLNAYTFLLEENGYKTDETAYLVYYYPLKVEQAGKVMFAVEPKEIKTSKEDAKKEFEAAVKVLRGSIPKKHTKCAYCNWNSDENGNQGSLFK
ncbi:MAG: PD-(D/E)XK nuclease family protein [Candidatus Niyogibacteria bacterium]|nr:PD-(D/E)XK nuclease family protein [Candidatus Niyogibacteria bacterium]